MSTPDDPILSAYVDGELDPHQVRSVEQAMSENPRLAQSVESLRAVRGLVSDLSRPHGPDLSPRILAELQAEPHRVRSWIPPRGRPRWIAAGIAAAVMIPVVAYSLVPPARRAQPPDNSIQITKRNGPPGLELPASTGAAPVATKSGVPPADSGRPALASTIRDERSRSTASALDVPKEPGNVARVRQLLDDPRLQRVFLITDRIDHPIEPEVTGLISRSTRHEFYRITVAQGIVIDSAHPGKATVLAVVLDNEQVEPLRQSLKSRFAGRFQESDADPRITLQLADVGQVVTLPANPDLGVTVPEKAIAFRQDVPPETSGGEPAPAAVPGDVTANSIERHRSRPDADPATTARTEAAAPPAGFSEGVSRDQLKVADTGRSSRSALGASGPSQSSHSTPSPPASAARNSPETALSLADTRRCVVLVWITHPGPGS